LANALDSVELQQMVGWLAMRYQRLAAKAERDGQYAAAVGALNRLRVMLVQPQLDRQFEAHFRGRFTHHANRRWELRSAWNVPADIPQQGQQRPLEIAKAASGTSNQLYPEQLQPRWMPQQLLAGGGFSCPYFGADCLNGLYQCFNAYFCWCRCYLALFVSIKSIYSIL